MGATSMQLLLLAAAILLTNLLSHLECKTDKRVDEGRGEGKLDESKEFEEDTSIFQLVIPQNDPSNACIKMNASFHFSVFYEAKNKDGIVYMKNVNFSLSEPDNFTYTGFCRPEKNMIELRFLSDWRLELYFYRASSQFLFNHVVLYYKLAGRLFPDSTHNGAQSEVYDSVFINSSISKSYRCFEGIEIDLNEVVIHMKHLRLEPFFNKRPSAPFDPEVACARDIPPVKRDYTNTAWIALTSLIFIILILLCCSWFVCIQVKSDRGKRDLLIQRI